MAERVIHVRASRRQVMRVLSMLPRIASGQSSAAGGVGYLRQSLLTRIGLTALSFIKIAFVQKARGGTDEAGERWKPLSAYTIARRRHPRGGKPGNQSVEILRDTGLLINSLTPGVPVTGTPPPVPPPKPPKQVFRLGRGNIILGTNRQWAWTHHKGIPGRIPQRKLWPDPRQWPKSWWDEILVQAQLGVIDIVIFLLKGTP